MKITKLLHNKWKSIVSELRSIFPKKESANPVCFESTSTRSSFEKIVPSESEITTDEDEKLNQSPICNQSRIPETPPVADVKIEEKIKTNLDSPISLSNCEENPGDGKEKVETFFILDSSKKPKFIFSQPLNSYRLLPLNLDGENVSDTADVDLYVGLDFGTSTLKCFLNDIDNERVFPVVFCESMTNSAYLLPTCIYIAQDQTVSLDKTTGTRVVGIKERLIKDHRNIRNRAYACAFLALALRRIRVWFNENLRDWYGDDEVRWIIHLGVPSITADHALAQTWEEILCTAWGLSIQKKAVSLPEVEQYLVKEVIFKNDEKVKAIACPEISAAINSIISCTHDAENGQLYAAMDVGASTVDISAFFFTRGYRQTKYCTTLLGPQIHILGTSFCHSNRMRALRRFVEKSRLTKEEKDNFIQKLLDNAELQPQTALPDSVESYCEGVKLSSTSKFGPDNLLIEKLSESLRTRILESWNGNFSRNSQKIKVLLIGGGCHSGMYAETIKRAVNSKRAELMEFPELPEALSYSRLDSHRIDKESFWSRFSVAYGLALGKIGETEIETLDHEENPYEVKELPGFIGKEMV